MKTKQLLLLSLLALASFAPHALAQFVPLAPIPGLTNISPTTTIDQNTLTTFFNNLYKYLIGLAATLAVIEIVWGGLEISTKDSVSKQSDGKERITQAIFGLVLVLSPVLVFSIINPSIINLSLNLPPIKLDIPVVPGSVPQDPATIVSNAAATAAAAGCNLTASAPITKISCPPDKEAPCQTFKSACPGKGTCSNVVMGSGGNYIGECDMTPTPTCVLTETGQCI